MLPKLVLYDKLYYEFKKSQFSEISDFSTKICFLRQKVMMLQILKRKVHVYNTILLDKKS